MLLPKFHHISSSLRLLRNKKILLLVFLLLISCSLLEVLNIQQQKKIHKQVEGVASSPFVSAYGTQLYLNGQPYQFTGINAYELATLPGVNGGCGGIISNLNTFFSSFRPNTMIRFWAYQGAIATNVTTKQLDWTQLDRLVSTASQYNQKLLLVLSPQSGQCDDGHWKDKAWYTGGYTQAFNDDGRGLAPLSFLDYAKAVVSRYKNATSVGMYELVSEPEPADCPVGYKGEGCYSHQTCPNETAAAQALRSFYDTVGGQLKQIDPNHLIESGVMGNGQCGAVYTDYAYIHQSPGVDVASYHDYGNDTSPMPGDIYNGLQKRLSQMQVVSKPLVVGEVGIRAQSTVANCSRLDIRYSELKAKMDAQFPAGVAGIIPWDWVQNNQNICTYDINPGDPVLTLLHNYPVSMGAVMPTSILTLSPTLFLTPTMPPTPVIVVPQTQSTKLGGIDLSGYCNFLKLPGATLSNGVWTCGSNGSSINLFVACQWQYKNNMAYAKQDILGNPYSWNCYLPPSIPTLALTSAPTPTKVILPSVSPTSLPQKLGGLNLSGYCNSLSLPGATVVNSTWRCGVNGANISMTSACQWQYKQSSAFAKQDIAWNPYSWTCYQY